MTCTVYDNCWQCQSYNVPLQGLETCTSCGAPRHLNAQPGSPASKEIPAPEPDGETT